MKNQVKELKEEGRKGRDREREGEREQSLGLHGLLSQHCGADRTAAAHADIYSCHARLPFAGPRRPLAPGLKASPSLEPLNITSLNHPQHLSSLCTKPGPCNNHITSIKRWIAGESEQLQHSMSDVKSPVKQERLCSSYVNSLCSAL